MPVEFEDELGDALRRTADTFRPDDPRELVSSGHLRGRRLRRRRTATVAVGAAAIAAVAVGGVVAGSLTQGGGGGHGSGVAAAPEQPKPRSTQQSASRPEPKPAGVSAKDVTRVFASLLPHGTVKNLHGTGSRPDDPFASASALFDNGPGPGLVSVVIQSEGLNITECPPPAQNPGVWCSITHVHGGSLVLLKDWEYPDHRGDVKDWTATFVTSSGAEVALSQWNSTDEKGAPKSRTNPPLNTAEMAGLVTSDAWKPLLAALPETKRPEGSSGKDGGPAVAGNTSVSGG